MPELSPEITTVFCDIDGVLRQWDPMDQIESAHDLAPGSLAAAAFDRDLLTAAITGTCTDEEWRANIIERLARTTDVDAATNAVRAWSEPCGDLNADVLAWIDLVRTSERSVYLASNATSRLPSDLARLGLLEHVDGTINSSDVGAAKPNEAFYAAALAVADVPAGACLFIDDQQANVVAAQAMGMHGICFGALSSLPTLAPR